MVLNRFYEFKAVKGFFLILTLFENVVDGQIPTQSRMQPVPQKICSKECKTWTPKEVWDDYLERKEWKMICENEEYKCCPGYEGPQCESGCFDCNRINGFERRFVEIYGKIKSLENTYTNQAIIINGSISKDNTGDKLTKSCTCSAGPRGQQGPAGPVGPPGAQGRQGIQGPKGTAGDRGLPGLPGITGPRGFMGLPGILGQTGQKGEAGLPGRHGRSGRKGEPGLNGLKGAEGQPGRPCRADIPDAACAKGEPGPPGLPGSDGHTGLQGKPGKPGLKGPSGFNGKPGRDGARGEKGKPGVPGNNGRPGLPGPKGETGVQGYKGPTGRPGLGGKPGEKGAPGLPGLDGRPCDITKVEESRTFREMQSIIENLVTRLEITTGQVEELRAICNRNVGCHFNCTADSFKCSCGMCIPQKFRCDGFPQCPDGSDEFESDCAIHCNKGNVPCRDGKKCVKLEERCDGKEDCPDGSDEENCEKQKQQHDNNFR